MSKNIPLYSEFLGKPLQGHIEWPGVSTLKWYGIKCPSKGYMPNVPMTLILCMLGENVTVPLPPRNLYASLAHM